MFTQQISHYDTSLLLSGGGAETNNFPSIERGSNEQNEEKSHQSMNTWEMVKRRKRREGEEVRVQWRRRWDKEKCERCD